MVGDGIVTVDVDVGRVKRDEASQPYSSAS